MTEAAWALRLTSISIRDFLDALPWEATRALEIDLRDLEFVSPTALTQLSAMLLFRGRLKLHTSVHIEPGQVSRYLTRSYFISVNRKWVEFSPPIPDRDVVRARRFSSNSPFLIELRRVQSNQGLQLLRTQVVESLSLSLQIPMGRAFAISAAISELVQNALEHSNSTPAFIAMQRYARSSGTEIEFAISDWGAGIVETLTRNPTCPPFAHGCEALQFAMRKRTSGRQDDPTRGMGLYHARRIALEESGSLRVRSGDSDVWTSARIPDGSSSICDRSLPGTHVTLILKGRYGV